MRFPRGTAAVMEEFRFAKRHCGIPWEGGTGARMPEPEDLPGFILWEQTDCLFGAGPARRTDQTFAWKQRAAYSRALCFAVGLPGLIGSADFFFSGRG